MNKTSDLIALLSIVITVIGAYLYFIGWTYAFYYFDSFSVGLASLDLPKEHFFSYAFYALARIEFLVLLIFISIAFFGLKKLLPFIPKTNSTFVGVIILALIGLFLSGFVFSKYASWDDLEAKRSENFKHYPDIEIWLNPNPNAIKVNEKHPDATFQDKYNSIRIGGSYKSPEKFAYKLLIQNNGMVYYFNSLAWNHISKTYVIPLSGVKKIEYIKSEGIQ